MTDWEPATEVEAAMRDALRADDQQLYFRILAGTDLFLPVSAQALAGEAPMGWGTWTTGGRTHVLAFTSPAAMRACLGADAGPSRRSPYADLAAAWPHHEWWLAVNPGLPVEGYLPAWFVSQLSRGDVRLPGRTMGARARLERVESLAAEQPGAGPADAWGQPQPPAAIGGVPDAPPARPATGQVPHPARAAHGPGAAPARTPGGQPTVPAPATRPEAVPADAGDPANGEPGPRPDPRDGGAGRPGPAWPIPPRRRLLAEGAGARSTGDEGPPNGHSSFFEPASGRSAAARAFRDNPLRSGERAAPPLRPGLGGQPFPRRRPAGQPGDDPTRAFRMDTDQARTPPVPGPGTNGSRPERPAEAPTQAFRAPGAEATEALPRRRPTPAPTPAEEPTQPLTDPAPRPVPAPTPVEEVAQQTPVSYAEPVSAPPAPRRGFSPIVIEGTVIESRDLPVSDEPAPAPAPRPAAPPVDTGRDEPPAGSDAPPHGTPGGPLTAPYGPEAEEPTVPVVPASGEPTRPISPAAGAVPPQRPAAPDAEGPTEPLDSLFADRSVDRAEPTMSLGSVDRAEPTVPLASPDRAEPTVSFGAQDRAESTVPLASPDPADPTVSLFADRPGAVDRADPTVPLASPDRADPTVSFGAQDRAESTVPLASPDRADPTVPLAPPDPAEPTVSLFADRSAVASADGGAAPVTSAAESATPADPATVVSPAPEPTPAAPVPNDLHPPVTSPVGEAYPLDEVYPVDGGAGEAVRAAPEPAVLPPPADPGFLPANEVEEELLDAAGVGSTDTFLSTLLLARVLLPVAPDSAPGSRPGDPGFVWRTEELDGERYVVVHTSPERLADHADAAVETVEVRFVQLIRRWPDEQWSFAVNPGTPVGAKLPGEQIVALANWAAEMGLGDDAEPEAATEPAPADTPRYVPTANDPTKPVVMQKAIAPSQLAYYLERGYDRVSGFVHRANELAHLTTPAQLHDALGLGYPDSPFARDAETIYVLRWPAYRPSLYRIPYGGQNEAAMRAMEGWVIERAPFRGNGFAPGESSDVVAEFKVDSARLPHGAQLWRLGADGSERVIAILDTDTLVWRQVGEP
ncbi:SseB family protein [Micromonospora coxensis]|uniref:SseB family protein n=1 Tax=Micromonospora coxensis TaxID=356852 RepID=UPI001E5D22EE|nr:SseB family protein [Micromonospora coxensis]